MEYYVWDTEPEAQAALDFINTTTWFPITGVSADSGEPAVGKAKTTKWADSVLQRQDGKWCFQRVPESRLDAIGVPANDRQSFLDAFNPTIETYVSTWFPE
jgi:hypothetical protein